MHGISTTVNSVMHSGSCQIAGTTKSFDGFSLIRSKGFMPKHSVTKYDRRRFAGAERTDEPRLRFDRINDPDVGKACEIKVGAGEGSTA